MNITVLTYTEVGGDRDEVVDQVAAALSHRHDVTVTEVHDDVGALVAELERRRPDLVFNLVEELAGNLQGDAGVAAILELLGIPFTGTGAGDLYLRQDKALSKKLLAFDGVLYPSFAVFSPDADFETGGNLRPPLFVKPLRGDASIGIGPDALVRDSRELMERVLAIHREQGDSALAEEYIEGRELYVGILGNRDPEALPPVELDLSGLPEGTPLVAHRAVKFDEEVWKEHGVEARVADLPDEMRARLQKVAIQAYRALRVRDYGRVDLRLTDTGDIYVLEVNANCYLEADCEFVLAASALGYDQRRLVERIVELAVERQPRPAAAGR
jgi:D-alanine-D-alanine ligase